MILSQSIVLLALAGAAIAGDKSDPRKDENVIALEPKCNKDGVAKGDDCQKAIDKLLKDYKDDVKGDKGDCKELAKEGDCSVAICKVNTDDSKMDKGTIGVLAQSVHAACRDGDKTGGTIYTEGLQLKGDHLKATIYVGEMDKAPKKRALRIRGRAIDSSSGSINDGVAPMGTRELVPRGVGDTLLTEKGKYKVQIIQETEVKAMSTYEDLDKVLDQVIEQWKAVDKDGATTLTVSKNSQTISGRKVTIHIAAYNGQDLNKIPKGYRKDIMESIAERWSEDHVPAMMTVSVAVWEDPGNAPAPHVHPGLTGPLPVVSVMIFETFIKQETDVITKDAPTMGRNGVHYAPGNIH